MQNVSKVLSSLPPRKFSLKKIGLILGKDSAYKQMLFSCRYYLTS